MYARTPSRPVMLPTLDGSGVCGPLLGVRCTHGMANKPSGLPDPKHGPRTSCGPGQITYKQRRVFRSRHGTLTQEILSNNDILAPNGGHFWTRRVLFGVRSTWFGPRGHAGGLYFFMSANDIDAPSCKELFRLTDWYQTDPNPKSGPGTHWSHQKWLKVTRMY